MIKKREEIKAIIFDLDGTLINSLPLHELAFKDLLLEHGIRLEENHLRKLIGLSTRLILKEIKKKYKLKQNVEDLREERRYHYFKFLGRKSIVFPGAQKILEDLRLNYKIAIATGSSFVTFSHSTNLEFKSLFDAIVTINDVSKERGKPYPDQLLLAAKKIHVSPKNCLVIGDSIYDAIASKRAKMRFLGVTTGFTSKQELVKKGAFKVMKSLSEIKTILKTLK